MKKAKKGLLLSLLTLLMAVAVTATSTYAWFMVNTEVTASNMQVGVKSDTTFLVISKTNELGTSLAEDFALTGQNATIPAVLPAKYDQTGTAQGTWKKARGTGYNDGTANGSYTTIEQANEGNHYVHFTFYVGVTSTTQVAATNLKVSEITVAKNTNSDNETFLPAVSVVLKCGSTYLNYTVGSDSSKTNGLNDLDATALGNVGTLLASLTPGTANQIDAYLYINGDNPVVTSANSSNLGNFKVSIKFACTEGVA